MEDTSSFFSESVPEVKQLIGITDPHSFIPVPDDWWIVIADVVGSTRAIERGNYKEVNGVGAACISAVLNACGEIEIPFVFGGDGASFCVPNVLVADVRRVLSSVRAMARDMFALELRIGTVNVAKVREQGFDTRVARILVSEGYQQACFFGGGIEYAEHLIKDKIKGAAYWVGEYPDAEADYSGFECRWDEVPGEREMNIALLVKSRAESDAESMEIYRMVISKIMSLFGPSPDERPLSQRRMKTSLSLKKLSVEGKIRTAEAKKSSTFMQILIVWMQSLLGRFFEIGDWTVWKNLSWSQYKADVIQNSDYQKFDDMLRMLIAADQGQLQELIRFLDDLLAQSKIVYGYHSSPTALITCLVFDRHNKHFHLIDGSRGGYALAAKMLKRQYKTS